MRKDEVVQVQKELARAYEGLEMRMTLNKLSEIVWVSDALRQALGYQRQADWGWHRKTLRDILETREADKIIQLISERRKRNGGFTITNVCIQHSEGHWLFFDIKCRQTRSGYLATVFSNVNESVMHDELTGAWSRKWFFEMADQYLRIAKRMEENLYFFVIDVDKLKTMNDIHGHDFGDLVLKNAAKMIEENLCRRPTDLIGRWGGDEFVALRIGDMIETKYVDIFSSRELAVKYSVQGIEFSLSPGLAVSEWKNPRYFDDLFKEADNKMYEEKKRKARDEEEKDSFDERVEKILAETQPVG